ncbi:aldehyde dehydrogenase family protein [Rubellimicrobium roseum]|uniref:Aldehyde dehydrogenase family protein n=1 Tax=Rubellimicrobium roseum TaxID=687525 RepID=A0A5C4NCY9_9RHOB|nr:aldehyde dehydrogenase family protein [Rubellimicrobium roseum]
MQSPSGGGASPWTGSAGTPRRRCASRPGSLTTTREPVGICAAFPAGNLPVALVLRKLILALTAMRTNIMGISSQPVGVLTMIVAGCRTGNLPAGMVGFATGPVAAIYAPLMTDKQVRRMFLTGSTLVAQQMIRDARATVKRVLMKLGANVPRAVIIDVRQACVTPDRSFAHARLHGGFMARQSKQGGERARSRNPDGPTHLAPQGRGDRRRRGRRARARTRPLSAAALARVARLRLGRGCGAADLPALNARGVALAVVDDMNSALGAEHAMTLILAHLECALSASVPPA